jgi:hypothetical protein
MPKAPAVAPLLSRSRRLRWQKSPAWTEIYRSDNLGIDADLIERKRAWRSRVAGQGLPSRKSDFGSGFD